jgi:hypothetical protein
MAFPQEKIKDFFEEETEKIAQKIEKTPMEKFFLFFLILITISAVVLGYLQFKKNIEEPLLFSYLNQKTGELRMQYNLENLNYSGTQNVTNLQKQDSDLDGLDDYSEIYIYHTNPYLEDTDSDGLPDKQEIQAGSDPNCATGQDCKIETAPAPTTSPSEDFNLNLNENIAAPVVGSDTTTADLLDIESQLLSGDMTLEELGINNPEMQQLLEQIKSQQVTDINQLNPEDKQAALQTLEIITPEEIRQELINRGFDKSQLDQIDDQALQKMFLDTLKLYK